jgi:MoxR-like ATPase
MIPILQMSNLIGREREQKILAACISLSRHLLLEGPVGVGKTFLAQRAAEQSGHSLIRIDGSPQFSAEKLLGYFDPPMVITHGYKSEFFIEGPLLSAMKQGGILFVNEINRLPTDLQNILLTVLDEGKILIPRLGWNTAKEGFCLIATQNPQEFIGTRLLSEALLDRFERLIIDYQSYEEERAIVDPIPVDDEIKDRAIELIRDTRTNPQIRRGASIRAAQALLVLYQEIPDFSLCAQLALSTRIEWKDDNDKNIESLIAELEKKKQITAQRMEAKQNQSTDLNKATEIQKR